MPRRLRDEVMITTSKAPAWLPLPWHGHYDSPSVTFTAYPWLLPGFPAHGARRSPAAGGPPGSCVCGPSHHQSSFLPALMRQKGTPPGELTII